MAPSLIRVSSVPALAASLALHAAAAALFFLLDLPLGRYAEEPAVFILFLAASAFLCCALAVCRTRLQVRVQAAVWLFLFLMLTFQFGEHVGERSFLLLAFVIVFSLRENFPLNLYLSLGAVAASGAVLLVWRLFSVTRLMTAAAAEADRGEAAAASAVFTLTLGAAAAALCLLARYRAELIRIRAENEELKTVMRKLSAAQLGYLEFARSAEERSSANERNRLSAELHDTIGYTFTNLEMILEAGMDLMESDRARLRDLLSTGLTQVRQSMKETRRALYLIRENRPQRRFFNAVQRLSDVFGKTTGVEVRIDYGDFPAHCGAEAESAFYHFIQEGLVNAFSHGKATQVWISFSLEGESLRATILDNGLGAGQLEEGIGILGMRERFGRLGGTLSIDSPPDGFRITAAVPING